MRPRLILPIIAVGLMLGSSSTWAEDFTRGLPGGAHETPLAAFHVHNISRPLASGEGIQIKHFCTGAEPYLEKPLTFAIDFLVDGDLISATRSSGSTAPITSIDDLTISVSRIGNTGARFDVRRGVRQQKQKVVLLTAGVACKEAKPPHCVRTAEPGSLRTFDIQDEESGLKSPIRITRKNVVLRYKGLPVVGNRLTIPNGTRKKITIHAVARNYRKESSVVFQMTNLRREPGECEPVFVTLVAGPSGRVEAQSSAVTEQEGVVSIVNGAEGPLTLKITVNGRARSLSLHRNEERSIDISHALQRGSHNRVRFVGAGSPGSKAQITIWEGPGNEGMAAPAGMAPAPVPSSPVAASGRLSLVVLVAASGIALLILGLVFRRFVAPHRSA